MAVACTHSYSFVSIETLSPGQACIFELHKPLPVIRNTQWYGYSHLTGFLFLGIIFCNWRKFTNQVISYHTCAIFSCLTVLYLVFRSLSNMLLHIMCKFPARFEPCCGLTESRGTQFTAVAVSVTLRAIWMWVLQNRWSLATQSYICDATVSIIMQPAQASILE